MSRTREEQIEHLQHLAKRNYRDHQCHWDPERQIWFARRPQGGAFWAELIGGRGGTLIIHGDGPDLMFRTWRGGDDLNYLIRFVAGNGIDRVREKLILGEGTVYDGAVARADVIAHLAAYVEADTAEAIYIDEEMLQSFSPDDWDDEYKVREALIDAHPDNWELSWIGMVPTAGLINAMELCRVVARAIDEKEAPDAQATT